MQKFNILILRASNNQVDRNTNASLYGGLTKFGRKIIQEMNRLGMMVDLSHTSYQTQVDALDEAKAPVIYSHSSVYSICNNTRNVKDDILLKLVVVKPFEQFCNVITLLFYNLIQIRKKTKES